MQRRIDTATYRTAEMTCVSRASSALEKNPWYRSDDDLAPMLLPSALKLLLRFAVFRRFFSRVTAPAGTYEYVIARTRYINTAFRRALADGFGQILIFGAGKVFSTARTRSSKRPTPHFTGPSRKAETGYAQAATFR
jgi:O-methyltransferase involved in polyketide biosynthesis